MSTKVSLLKPMFPKSIVSLGGIPWKVRFDMEALYSCGSGRSGRLTGAAFGRQQLAKLLLKARPGENWTPEITILGFLTTRLKT